MINIFLICFACGYFVGSIPFGLVLTRLAGCEDIRKIGSGSIGATNVLRTGRKDLALLTVLLDASKAGFVAWLALKFAPTSEFIVFGTYTTVNVVAALIAGSATILGHSFPIWLKFKGGKGVASTFGFVLVMTPFVALLQLITWLIFAIVFRYSSLSAIVAAILTPLFAYFYAGQIETIFYTGVIALVLIRHEANIKRLIKGEESKISFKKKK